jgi:hypothetical protein
MFRACVVRYFRITPMPNLTREQLAALIAKLDEVCRQSQELQKQLRAKMAERARMDRLADDVGHGKLSSRANRRRRKTDDKG